MTKIYACLAGNWVCINDASDCSIGDHLQNPYYWWERAKDIANSMYCLDYIHVFYKGKDWRINPMFIQIVTE